MIETDELKSNFHFLTLEKTVKKEALSLTKCQKELLKPQVFLIKNQEKLRCNCLFYPIRDEGSPLTVFTL